MKAESRKVLGALLRKQFCESAASFAKGNFNVVGFAVRTLLIVALIAIFVVFFGDFADVYLAVTTDGEPAPLTRAFELMTMVYAAIMALTVIGAMTALERELFSSEDVRIFSALPIGANTIFAAKAIVIYARQTLVCTVCVLTANITVAAHASVEWYFWLVTALSCPLLPMLSVGIASVLALPIHALKVLLKDRFAATFVLITLVTAALLFAYAYLLRLVSSMLLGEDLRYFFNDAVMAKIAAVVAWLHPADLFAALLTGKDVLSSALVIAAVLVVCFALSLIFIKLILTRALKAQVSSGGVRHLTARAQRRALSPLAALIKKEFLLIFRTPDYMFSYFSVALVVPLLVYFCMSISSALVVRLIGISCDLELALFLSLLFGSLANVFCTTNISRDGMMFYSVKVMPLGYRSVVFSKVLLCLVVAVLSQLLTAILLCAAGGLDVLHALFVFAVASAFSFSQICFATRIDFDHAKFSSQPDGEIKEQSNTAALVVVVGMLTAFAVGGAVLASRMALSLRGLAQEYGFLTYLIGGALAVVAAAGGWLFLVFRLKERYYRFEGGAL